MKTFLQYLTEKYLLEKDESIEVEVDDKINNKTKEIPEEQQQDLEEESEIKADKKTISDDDKKLELASKLTILFSKNIGVKCTFGEKIDAKKYDIWELKSETELFPGMVGRTLYKYFQNQMSKGIQWRGAINFCNYYKNNVAKTQIGNLIVKIEKDNQTGGIYTYDENSYATLEDAIFDNNFILIYGGGYDIKSNKNISTEIKNINTSNLINLQS